MMNEIAKELKDRVDADQAARLAVPQDWGKILKLDKESSDRMKELVAQYGWITISKFGEEASENAWLLVQHSEDIEFQKRCLELMKSLPEGEVSKKNIGMLTDRILMKTTGIQKYGSHYITLPDCIVIQPVEDPDHLDELRSEVGFTTVAERFKDEHKPVYLLIRKKLLG